MFDDKIKQKINVDVCQDRYVIHFGIQDSLLRSIFGRGAKSHFSAKTDLELFEKIDSIIDMLENGSAKAAFGFYLVYPRSSLCWKGIIPLAVFEHQKEQVLKDLKILKTIL